MLERTCLKIHFTKKFNMPSKAGPMRRKLANEFYVLFFLKCNILRLFDEFQCEG